MATNYKQTDSRWANYPYAGETMSAAGCGATAVADLLNKLPTEIANWMTANGYASNGSGTYQSGITACIRAYGYSCNQLTSNSRAGIMNDSSFETFKSSIQNGNCGILLMGGLNTGCRNSYWSKAGHFIAVVGYSNGKYNVYDPAWDARDGYHDWYDFQGNIKHVYTTNIRWTSGGSSSASSSSTYDFSCDQIKAGSQGKTVKLLQTLLRGRGWNIDIDGSFGNATRDIVVAIQKFFNLTADGIVGIKTWRALIPSESSTDGIKCVFKLHDMKVGYQGADAYFLQNMLKGLGYYTGDLDLSFGNGCLGAVKAYQKACGMTGDGEVGKNTYRNLIGF